jgi:hypothetical protein
VTKAIVIGGVISASLRRYEERRNGSASRELRTTAAVGRVTQMENPLLCRLRDEVAKRVSSRARLRQYEKIARYRV